MGGVVLYIAAVVAMLVFIVFVFLVYKCIINLTDDKDLSTEPIDKT